MSKRHKFLIALGALVVVLPIAFVILIATFDWNRARPWVETRIGQAIGRSVFIDGDLGASWHWRWQTDAADTWSPGLVFSARKVRVGNPDWAKRPQFAQFQAVDVALRLWPLLRHELALSSVRLMHPVLDIERRGDGSNNWTFASTAAQASTWTLDIGEIQFDAGEVSVADAERGLDVHADISALDAPIAFGQRVEGDDPSTRREVIQQVGREAAQRLGHAAQERAVRAAARNRTKVPLPYLFAWKASGTLHGARVTGNGRFGGVLALRDARHPFPLRADIEIGATDIALTGTITDPASPDAIDMRLWISGPNLADLYEIAGLALPNTPPYATVGRLAGRFHPRRSVLRYQDFTARVGGSDLAGTLTYRSGDPRPTLTGKIDSTLLQFKDLGALIGAGSQARGEASSQPSDPVLPGEPFKIERWRAMDAAVHFTGKRVVTGKNLPISHVDARIGMKAGVLTLDPLRFSMAGGTVAASLRIDANSKPPKGEISLDARALQLRRLFEKVADLSTSLGGINGHLRLAGNGTSIAAQLGSSDGSITLAMTDGKVSAKLMEEAGLNVANILVEKIAGDRQIDIDCAAADFAARNGVLTANLFVFDTDTMLIDIDGQIRLADERVDLTLHPHTKGLRVLSLRSPLHVRGDFRHLDVSVDKKALLARVGGALALGLVAAPLAAIAPLIAPSADAQKSCAPLFAKISESARGKAGKTAVPAKGQRPRKR